MSAWQTEQFIGANSGERGRRQPLAATLNDYLALADRLLAGAAPDIEVALVDDATHELQLVPLNDEARSILESSRPSTKAVGLLLRAYCGAVAQLVDQGKAEAAAVNAMRLERLYLQYEHARRFEPRLRARRDRVKVIEDRNRRLAPTHEELNDLVTRWDRYWKGAGSKSRNNFCEVLAAAKLGVAFNRKIKEHKNERDRIARLVRKRPDQFPLRKNASSEATAR